MKLQLISVIVPIFNVEKHLKRCVESIRQQTYENLEIILVDDGSSDKCPQICDSCAAEDDRIVVIHKPNGGIISAKKIGAEAARGEYIICVDGDDWIEKDRVKDIVERGVRLDKDIVYVDGVVMDYGDRSALWTKDVPLKIYDKRQVREELLVRIERIRECFRRDILVTAWVWAVKRELFRKIIAMIDDRISQGEDQYFVWIMLLEANSAVAIRSHSVYHYVQHEKSMTYLAEKKDVENLKVWYKGLKETLEQYGCSDIIFRMLLFSLVRLIFVTDYSVMLRQGDSYLYPFSSVKKGSRVIVYGAGRFGQRVMRALESAPEYVVVSWIDQNPKTLSGFGYGVESIDTIHEKEYDMIIIALIDRETAIGAAHRLAEMGIEERRIAMMDFEVIDEAALPIGFAEK